MKRKSPEQYLEELRRIARRRGGTLLSRTWVSAPATHRFRCAEGHVWATRACSIKEGRWCRVCGSARTGAKLAAPAIRRLRGVVARRGGTAALSDYVNGNTKLRFTCHEGHEWDAAPGGVLEGAWCPVCAIEFRSKGRARIKLRVLRRFQALARRRGGELLSDVVHMSVPLRFRCAHGHTWATRAKNIDQGSWCPACKEESAMALLRAAAKRWGGELLSEKRGDHRTRLEWRCAQGHRFKLSAFGIRRGHWCAKCRNFSTHDIELMHRIAHERRGECLSSIYLGSSGKLRWRCHEGHEWEAAPNPIINGSWCPVCNRGWGHHRRLSIEIMREAAADRGGACLSTTYKNSLHRLRWRCARGHTWEALPGNVLGGAWCHRCAHVVRGTLDGMRAMAIERGGRCLTTAWNNHKEPLLFVCGQGHRFRLRGNVAKTGVWCPRC